MSSVARTSQQPSDTHSHHATPSSKKKFGNNLNKLTKPPAPPSAAAANKQSQGSSRNGLLLLSTKRSHGSGEATGNSSAGILSSKSVTSSSPSKPLPNLNLQYESELSTHEALLGAVVGASRTAEAQRHQPDAWGVAADKQQQQQQQHQPTVDGEENGKKEKNAETLQAPVTPPRETTAIPEYKETSTEPSNNSGNPSLPTSNWDEYGGRGVSNDGDDTQVLYMSQMAKERAEKRRSEEDARQREQQERAANKLRELDEKKQAIEERKPSVSAPSNDRNIGQRTLYDPTSDSRSYSALVGSGNDLVTKNSPLIVPRTGHKAVHTADPLDDSRDAYSRDQPVIQLSSYEDRDRGTTGGGPRMLYDPKSGSMVAVPSREDPSNVKKPKKNRRKEKGRKDIKQEETTKAGTRKESKKDMPAKETKKGKPANGGTKKLPRTCGVLYARDNKGNFFCTDGCDGDLGHGAHSVPGGRARNLDAYSKFVENQEHGDHHLYGEHHLEAKYEMDIGVEGLKLQTGLNVPNVMTAELDWIKPGEKIGLVTGIEDSPTLQATAKEWAPSQAALAAAAARTDVSSRLISADSIDEEDEEGGDHGDHAALGLGFDPTLHMDSMMQSPPTEPANGLDAVNLAALSLEPAIHGTTQRNHSIFAFDSGSTWGAGNAIGNHHIGNAWGSSGGGSHDWGVSTMGNGFSTDGTINGGVPATFLSLNSNTWGGVPGLANGGTGTSVGSSPMNEHSRSHGD